MSSDYYFAALARILSHIDSTHVDEATRVLLSAYEREATIYVVGNGGSATTATHLALDLTKNPVATAQQRRVRCIALTDNTAALTAWADDITYDCIFQKQLASLWREGDVLVVISGSGNSPNIVRAVEWANAHHGTSIGLLGRGGGTCAQLCHVSIIVPDMDYGHAETAHLALVHYWVDVFRAYLTGR